MLLTSIAPIPGSDCRALTAVRTITLDSGSGSLTLAENGTLCPPNAAATSAQGNPFTVDKRYTIASGTGVFAGAAGSGSDINRSAGNSQVPSSPAPSPSPDAAQDQAQSQPQTLPVSHKKVTSTATRSQRPPAVWR